MDWAVVLFVWKGSHVWCEQVDWQVRVVLLEVCHFVVGNLRIRTRILREPQLALVVELQWSRRPMRTDHDVSFEVAIRQQVGEGFEAVAMLVVLVVAESEVLAEPEVVLVSGQVEVEAVVEVSVEAVVRVLQLSTAAELLACTALPVLCCRYFR